MSFAEVIVVMALLGVMAYFLVILISNVVPGGREVTAEENLNQLNAAILRFNQANWELVLEPQAGNSDDELAIFQSLQYRHPSRPAPGSPFLSPRFAFVASDDGDTYRATWNGRQFEMLAPGTAGLGLDLNRMVETSGSPTEFATNYSPVGAR